MNLQSTSHRVARAELLPPAEQAPEPRNAILREFLDRVVASVFAVDTTLLKLPTRGRRPVAEARQVAMYLAHVSCSQSLTSVGRIFERDRTTVAHACKRVEDRREDPQFDAAIDLLERTIRMIHLDGAAACGE
jgi:chromosomal replication initiation ATPase DnaA